MQPPVPLRRILLIRNDRMGDLLMSMPAVHQIRAAFPEAKLTLLIQEDLAELLEGHPDADRILRCDPRQGQGWGAILRWARILRRERFDCAAILNPTRLFHAATFLARIPTRAGYRRKWGSLLTRSIPDTKQARGGHEAEYNLELVRLLGIQASEPVLSLPTRPETEAEAAGILESRGIRATDRPVAVHPWTSNESKSWPLDSFLQLIRSLDASGVPVLVIGGQECRAAMQRWKGALPSSIADLVGQVPLRLLPALLRRCRVMVSNDSGPVHVAAAVGTPAVVVAPQSHAALLNRWRPLGDRHRILIAPGVDQVAAAIAEQRAG